jgi:ATP-dependent DNA helicase RecQ
LLEGTFSLMDITSPSIPTSASTPSAGQEEAIQSLLNKNHTLAIMPTGAGKSLIYQFAALLLGQDMQFAPTALVISPLISLMKDQVDALVARGLPATFVNSAIPLTKLLANSLE